VPLSEKQLITRIRRAAAEKKLAGVRPPRQREKKPLPGTPAVGIGDDCAVLRVPPGNEVLVTTDFNLEDVHFRREWHPPDAVGHRCLARGLSDIAAMGGVPRAAFLSLALPPELPQNWVDEFVAGFLKLARRYSVLLAGGDTAQSPDGILADIMVLGSIPRGQAILRSGAKSGDAIYVTGSLGEALADLNKLRDGEKLQPRSHQKHFYPEPRLAVGQFLRERKLASAMIDISDGLSTDLSHICEESGTGAVIYADTVPIATGARSEIRFVSGQDFSRADRASVEVGALAPEGFELALHGGDEYELLFTARPNCKVPKKIAGVPVTRIGEIVRGLQMKLARTDGKTVILKPSGWEHFG
jgi:thiamine-monophosphate kinase